MNRSWTRLWPALRMDFSMHARYGFYYAAAFVAAVWIAILRALPAGYLDTAIPFIIFADLGIVGMTFIGGQVLFEKAERTLYALVTSPLTFGEYLASKLISLTAMAWVASIAVVVSCRGSNFRVLPLCAGIVLTSLVALVVGLIAVAPYQSISTFIMPLQLYVMVMSLPLLDYFGWVRSPLFYLLPTQGALILLRSGFVPVNAWQVVYAVAYQILWIAFLIRWAEVRFERYIIARQGTAGKL